MTTYAESLEASRWTWEANEKHANETARQMIEHYGWNASLSYAEIKEFLSYTDGRKQKKPRIECAKCIAASENSSGESPRRRARPNYPKLQMLPERERLRNVVCMCCVPEVMIEM